MPDELNSIDFVGDRLAARLADHGYRSRADLADVSVEQLLEIDGIGLNRAFRLTDVAQ